MGGKMRKALSSILALLLALSVTACSSGTAATTAAGTAAAKETVSAVEFQAGTYTGTATGHNGPVTVEVTLSDHAIEDIKVSESSETSGIGDVAFSKTKESILENQSLDTDVVSSCTISYIAYRSAVESALKSAGADVDALKKVPQKEKEATSETIDTDVAVIGSGAAGLMAAIEASSSGADVVILEKLPRTGGATRTSSGMIVAGGTKLQEEAGIEDSTEALKEYWMERGEGNVDEEFVDFVADNINDVLDQFIGYGVDYNSNLILQSGTATVNRAHMPSGAGAELCDALVKAAEDNGVKIYTDTKAESLIQDNGAVVGVNATTETGTMTVNAKAVVIATGGYATNEEMLEKYSPNAAGAWSMSGAGSTGDGITMGIAAGADTVFKGGFIGWKVCTPAYDHTTAIGAPIYGAAGLIVDETGKRFVNESLDYPFVYNGMEEDGSDTFYYIFQGGEGETVDLENNVSSTIPNLELGVEAGVCYKADTIEELAEAANLPDLTSAVEAYNNAVATGTDEEFGRDTSTMTAYENGPFYALRAQRATLGTFGGLSTNVTGEVVGTDGNNIAGLYAAGEVANGKFFPVIYPASGSSIAMCVTLGKEAGASAAAYALNK
jgi:flavocytochrome c